MNRKLKLLALPILGLAGCQVTLKDKGGVEAFFGTSLGIRTETSATNAQSEAKLNSQPFEEWLKSQNKTEAKPDGAVDTNGLASTNGVVVPSNL